MIVEFVQCLVGSTASRELGSRWLLKVITSKFLSSVHITKTSVDISNSAFTLYNIHVELRV